MSLFVANILLIFVANAKGFVVSQEDPVLPVQEIDPANPNYIIRTLPNNEVDIIGCPRHTYFDRNTLTCQIFETYAAKKNSWDQDPKSSLCKDGNGFPQLGIFPNPNDCGSFLQCGPGTWNIMKCAPGTMFNKQTLRCDYPYQACCCEFLPEDDTKLVGPENLS
ncbi:uncharacterized protein LOC132696998 [Cylas formicarius]|uniref:uncharacterized protein LOC132696998 n=1 Tax=Cylas formicarius TaxID=197179 RepID=UPI00295872F3|nr:uncharacterized protein LOC132696998 [Cylas formicarius]